MSLAIAEQMYKTLKDPKTCSKCEHYAWEDTRTVLIPFCKKKWFGGECEEEDEQQINRIP